MRDEIIEQVWKAKDDIARECGYDLDKLADLLRKKQDERKHKIIDYAAVPASTRAKART